MEKTQQEYVVLLNQEYEVIGKMEKIEAHQKALLHKAFSIFLFNEKNEVLLQRRAISKYHSGGLWTNTCCGHPRPKEKINEAALRRLGEELNIQAEITEVFSFEYKEVLDKGLTEHEYDHVFFGKYETLPTHPNPDEVSECQFTPLESIAKDIHKNPDKYTAWFKIIFNQVKNHIEQA